MNGTSCVAKTRRRHLIGAAPTPGRRLRAFLRHVTCARYADGHDFSPLLQELVVPSRKLTYGAIDGHITPDPAVFTASPPADPRRDFCSVKMWQAPDVTYAAPARMAPVTFCLQHACSELLWFGEQFSTYRRFLCKQTSWDTGTGKYNIQTGTNS